MRRGQVLATAVAVGMVGLPASGLAQEADDGPPTGSEVVLDLPEGDLHWDEGLTADPTLTPALDLTGIDATWDDDGIVLTVDAVGRLDVPQPPSDPDSLFAATGGYSLTLMLVDLSENGFDSLLVSWDGVEVTGYPAGTGSFEECGGGGSLDADGDLVVTLPTDCLAGLTTLWLSAQSVVFGQVNAGDLLLGGDEETFNAGFVARLHAPGTEPAESAIEPDDPAALFGPDEEVAEDEEPANEVVRWSDPAGDGGGFFSEDEAVGAADFVRFEVAEAGGFIEATMEFADGVPDEGGNFFATLAGQDGSGLALYWIDPGAFVGLGEEEAAVLALLLSAQGSRPQDWGTRACRTFVDVDEAAGTVSVTTRSSCSFGGTIDFGFLLASASDRSGYSSDALIGSTEWTRTPPPLVTRPEARDVTSTCDGRAQEDGLPDADGNVHEPGIRCIAGFGITLGKADGTYGTKDLLSRGQIATFLVRTLEVAGVPLPDGDGTCTGGAHGDNLDRLIAAEVMDSEGCDVASRVTRSQMAQSTAAALVFAGFEARAPTHWFTDDLASGAEAELAHDTVAQFGIVTGTATLGAFAPEVELRRDAMATFLARMLDTLLDG